MFRKIVDFLYRVTHASGRLVGLKVDLGPFCLRLWVGRADGDAVTFAADVSFTYFPGGYPMLTADISAGVIEVDLSLTRSSSE